MSADAKIWFDTESQFGTWEGLHDGVCEPGPNSHFGTAYDLSEVITGIEKCMGRRLRWVFRSYPDGNIGLSGYGA